MELREVMILAIGLACTAIGIGLLYLSWKSHIQLKDTYSVTGWLLLANSSFYWIVLAGWEFGVIYTFTLPSFMALTLIMRLGEFRASQLKLLKRTTIQLPSFRKIVQFCFQFLMAVPFALAASILISIGIAGLLSTSQLNQMVFSVIFMPFLWGLFAYWSVADTQCIRPALSMLGLSALSVFPVIQG